MIPSVEERQVRPCEECIFSNSDVDYDLSCNMDLPLFYCKNYGYTPHRPEQFRGIIPDPTYPCVYHHTREEMKELLGAIQ